MKRLLLAAFFAALALPVSAANMTDTFKKGTIEAKSLGAMCFGPDGVLFIADPKGFTVYAIATGDTKPTDKFRKLSAGIDAEIAAMLGGKVPEGNFINDMKVNPLSQTVYLSCTWNGKPILLTRDCDGKIAEFSLKDVNFSSVSLKKVKEGNARAESVTGLVFHNDRLFVAALPSEEFASNLRTYSVPFEKGDDGITTEIFHGAHGKYETASPVQSLMAIEIGGKMHVLAGYTCTPLVKFPVEDLKGGKKLRGTTVAELGNQNKPLDMISYKKDGKEYLLIANTARGVMKVSTEGIEKNEGITMKTSKAGLNYETQEKLKGVIQLDKHGNDRAVILKKGEKGLDLESIMLP